MKILWKDPWCLNESNIESTPNYLALCFSLWKDLTFSLKLENIKKMFMLHCDGVMVCLGHPTCFPSPYSMASSGCCVAPHIYNIMMWRPHFFFNSRSHKALFPMTHHYTKGHPLSFLILIHFHSYSREYKIIQVLHKVLFTKTNNN